MCEHKGKPRKSREVRAASASRLLLIPIMMTFCAMCFAQDQPIASDALLDNRGQGFYLNAKPYIYDSLPQLKKEVHELRGLHPAVSQKPLPMILSQTGSHLKSMVASLPNLVAMEDVIQFRAANNGSGEERIRSRYDYLILVYLDGQEPGFEERRTAFNGRHTNQAGLEEGFIVTTGFATIWRYLLPSIQPESRFRYLGRQQVNKTPTYVVGFAQRPGWAMTVMDFMGSQKTTVCLVQGVAWIETSSFRIIRLRTDLLAPRPDVGLQKMTTIVNFGAARIAQVPSPLWLPVKAEVEVHDGGYSFKNIHRYSRYQLFRSQVHFLPPSGKP
ncbi:MAG TPA: hypothetical protein VGX94_04770 [Terriglobia bacterium]|nr:hypothetical protein [Terriglobia bacterium]